VQLESRSKSRPARSESGPARALDGLYCNIIAPRRSGAVNGHDQSLRLPDTIIMEPFQQYLAETFHGDGKHSTSGVVHELDLTVNAC